MKGNVLFAALLALILSIGFYGADIAGHFIGSSDDQPFSVQRNGSSAIYLSDDSGFDPMSIVETFGGGELPSYSADCRAVGTAIAEAMSLSDISAEMAEPVSATLFDSWKVSRNGYLYTEKWQYLNSAGSLRFFDCIIRADDLAVVYIRFYSPEKERGLSADEVSRGLAQLDSFSGEFYPSLAEHYSGLRQLYSAYSELYLAGEYGKIPEELLKYGALAEPAAAGHNDQAELRALYSERYAALRDMIRESSASPLDRFWLPDYAFLLVELSGRVNKSVGAVGVLDRIADMSEYKKPSYSTADGRIYQSLNIGGGELVVIYNIRSQLVEGYCWTES